MILSDAQKKRLYREAINPPRVRITRDDFDILLYDTIWNNRAIMNPWHVLRNLRKRYEVKD